MIISYEMYQLEIDEFGFSPHTYYIVRVLLINYVIREMK
jgi:hypothetical protein